MKKTVIVSGCVCTGKTTIAKLISGEKNLKYVDVNKLISKYGLSEGYDKERDCKIIDTKKLNLVLIDEIRKFKEKKNSKYTGLIIDSHLSHFLPAHYVDLCIITKCSLPELKKRLEKRGYSKEKVRENLDAEIFDTCRIEAIEKRHKVKVICTDKKIQLKELVDEIMNP
ncbi:AAA family ATPase [Candidatus Woesearchaeota archaeon]|nr:AAA family ATPase [Candidatus Woesearchaeota archaeon]